MSPIAIIGGTGLDQMAGLEAVSHERVDTPWGAPSAALMRGRLGTVEVLFLPRHGGDHGIAPHRINYRANLWALHQGGAQAVVAIAAVGGISAPMTPGRIAIPAQIIDYTWGRAHTFCDGEAGPLRHVDFTDPYSPAVRAALIDGARAAAVEVVDHGVYGATQGPRLESAAEIERLARDGCDLVGMTAMPEAALARELDLPYGACAVIANRAAGRGVATITMEAILRTLEQGMADVRRVLAAALPLLAG